MKSRCEPALKFLTALVLAFVAAPLCSGRQTPVQRPPRSGSTQSELQRTLERDLLFREMESMARDQSQQSPRQLAVAQINEDFERIQVVNHALSESLAAGEELDFKLVGQAASEIRKRAGRLKTNLILPGADEARPKSSDLIEQGRLKESLAALDRLVLSFVSNPGFRSVKVIDPQWAAAARRDLSEIIELTGRLKKSCEQWQKAAQKSH